VRLSLVTGPDGEPVVATEAIAHLRLEPDTGEDELLEGLIVAAREYAEAHTGRQLLTATWKLTLDRFPYRNASISLPLPPLQSVTSIKYLDTAGVLQTWASNQYVVDAPAGPRAIDGRVYPVYGVDYPDTLSREDAVTIEYVAGYGDAASVPSGIKQAMLLAIGHWYEQRESVIVGETVTTVPMTVDALLGPYTLLSGSLR
jgi:uncharacterized phiE125 gp8 family phage protein